MNECHLKLKMLQLTKAPEALKSCQELWATPPPAEHLSLEVQGAILKPTKVTFCLGWNRHHLH